MNTETVLAENLPVGAHLTNRSSRVANVMIDSGMQVVMVEFAHAWSLPLFFSIGQPVQVKV